MTTAVHILLPVLLAQFLRSFHLKFSRRLGPSASFGKGAWSAEARFLCRFLALLFGRALIAGGLANTSIISCFGGPL